MEDAGKATERAVVARMYQVDDAERNSKTFQFGKPRVQLDGTIFNGGFFPRSKTPEMRAAPEPYIPPPFKSEAPQIKDLSEEPYKLGTTRYEKYYKIVEERFDGKKTEVNTDEGIKKGYKQDFQIEGSLKSEGTSKDKYTTNKEYQTKNRTIKESTKSYIEETYQSPELNKGGVGRAAIVAGGVGAIQEFNNWFPIVADVITGKTRNMMLERDAAAKRAFDRNYLPIPPEPKDLPRIKLRLESEHGKEKAAFLMRKIEEMSYAAWGSQ